MMLHIPFQEADEKTHYILFRRPKSKVKLSNSLSINGTLIEHVKSTKFLGIMIDEQLKFCEHIQYIKGKISRGLGIIYKAKTKCNKSTLLTLYYFFSLPLLQLLFNSLGEYR